jgi:vitamin B12 transporter
MNKPLKILAFASLLPAVSFSEEVELPPIVVTGTRTPFPVERLPAAVTVFTREDIERLQIKTLPDLFKGSAGLDLTQNGSFGKTTSVFLRGTESDHVLVLIDGLRVGSATLGTTPFEFIPVEQIERVEITRGPFSSLYGSDAIGGVIQIFTRKGSGPLRLSGSAGGGTFNSYELTGTAGGEYKDSHYNLTVDYFNTQGYNLRPNLPPDDPEADPDDDGYNNLSVAARAGHRFGKDATLDGFFLRAAGETEFDAFGVNKTEFVEQVAGGWASYSPFEFWKTALRLGESRDNSDNFAPSGTLFSRFDTRLRQVSWQNDFSITENHLVTAGVDFYNQSIDSTENFSVTSRDDTGVYGQYIGRLGRNNLVASVRWDNISGPTDESPTTGYVGWSYNWDNGIRLLASYGTAFKTPTFNDLFFPGFGNPDLKPESSKSYEVGLEGRHGWGYWSLRAFRTNVDDLITTVFDPVVTCPPPLFAFGFCPQNIDKAQIDGLEIQAGTRLGDWNASLAYTLLDPKNETTGKRLPRRVENTLKFELSRALGPLSVSGIVLAQSDRYDDALNTIRVPGYAIVNLSASYQLTKNLSLRGELGNLLDKDYELVSTFREAGRNFFVSLYYQSR